jgi:long-chain fatty acid transport protein
VARTFIESPCIGPVRQSRRALLAIFPTAPLTVAASAKTRRSTALRLARSITLIASMLAAVGWYARAQGIVAPGAGPVLRSYGGTAIAAPLDGIGALYWNPATLSFLDNRIDIGSEVFWKNQTVESTIPPNLLGPGRPSTSVTGKTKSDDGVQLGPATVMVGRLPAKRWSKLTLAAGVFPYSGGGSNYPADPNNPTLAGLGGWFNSFVILTFPFAAAYKVNDHLALGLAADFATVSWQWSRAIFAHPDTGTLNGVNVTQYAPAVANPKYGAGAHAGAYYHATSGLGLGLMVKSPIWFQTLDYKTTTLLGQQRTISVKANTPFFVGAGLSYDGREKWLFAMDFKYALYRHMTGYYADRAFFQPDGTVNGLGYDNGLAVTSGIQYKASAKLSARIGYKYSTRIVPNTPTFELTASSLRHAIGGGVSYELIKGVELHATYVQSWALPIDGEMTSPLNEPIPGSRMRLTLVEYAPSFGITIKY